jgi:prophage regulatory protein
MDSTLGAADRLIDKRELRRRVIYSPQQIDRLEKAGLFPLRVKIGPGRVGWLLSEVLDWMSKKVADRDKKCPAGCAPSHQKDHTGNRAPDRR